MCRATEREVSRNRDLGERVRVVEPGVGSSDLRTSLEHYRGSTVAAEAPETRHVSEGSLGNVDCSTYSAETSWGN